jgi:uncharacterized protein YjbJ (UPF0337 family)
MRRQTIAIFAACLVGGMSALPLLGNAQGTPAEHTDARGIWEKFKGSWEQTKGAVRQQWGKLTDDDLMQVQGQREVLVGKIQARYGISHDQAEAQVANWERKQSGG